MLAPIRNKPCQVCSCSKLPSNDTNVATLSQVPSYGQPESQRVVEPCQGETVVVAHCRANGAQSSRGQQAYVSGAVADNDYDGNDDKRDAQSDGIRCAAATVYAETDSSNFDEQTEMMGVFVYGRDGSFGCMVSCYV